MRPLIAHRIGIIFGDGAMVRGGGEALGRIGDMRQIIERAPTGPFMACIAGHGQEADPARSASGDESCGLLADVAVRIGINKIFWRQLPAAKRVAKFLPALRAVERERCQISSAAWL